MSSTLIPAVRHRYMITPGSMSPQRVPITRPSIGVSPIDVSTGRPPTIADADAPLPRCSTIWFSAPAARPGTRPPARRRTGATCRETRTGGCAMLRPIPVDRVRRGRRWQVVEEGGVEHRDMRRSGSALRATSIPSIAAGCAAAPAATVRRASRSGRRRQRRADRVRAAVHHPMSDGDQRDVSSRCTGLVEQFERSQAASWSRRVVAQRPRRRRRRPASPIRSTMPSASMRPGSGRRLVLDRRRPGVDHQDRARGVITCPAPGSR